MTRATNLNRRIVESLYNEALILADESRAAFDPAHYRDDAGRGEDAARVALSCEALRTTTRVMQSIAWLLNQRAYFNGEISEIQLRLHGRLPPKCAASDPEHLELIDLDTRRLIESSERLYDRISRLDEALGAKLADEPHPFDQLRERLIGELVNS